MRFFKKEVPRTPIYLSNGDKLQFEPKGEAIGFYQTDKPFEIDALLKLEREHRGGVAAISQEEFDKKKAASTSSGTSWREEIVAGIARDTINPPTAPVAAVRAAAEPAVAKPAVELPKKAVRPPNVGRRL